MMGFPIRVAVRVRPLLPTDRLHEVVCVDVFPCANQIVLGKQNCFTVNYALPMNCSQSQLFVTTVYPLINCVLEGYDISVVAYGQSGSGKTYTILGPGVHCALSETEYGIIPRVTREIFSRLTQTPGRTFKATVSFIEIYDNEIRDLLNTSQFKKQLIIIGDLKDTTVVGAEEIECQNVSEVFNCLHVGMSNRQVGWITAQQPQYRSHCLFTLTLEQQWIVDGVVHNLRSKAQFTDLGGFGKTVLVENGGHFISESVQLDCGLVALGSVVSALTQSQWQHVQVPYMQSVLTRLLKSSFGGKAATLVIGCVSPASLDFNETLNCLSFLTQIRCITNTPVMNAVTDGNDHEHNVEVTSEEQYTDVLDSEERSTNADMFGLEFAASQWLKLVANAEDLFSKLVISKCLSQDEKDQIEHWLCLKQECEECVGSDDGTSCRGVGRVLERIDEITESEENTGGSHGSLSLKMKSNCQKNVVEKTTYESETESEQDSQHPDFLEKLDDLIKKFKHRTDGAVRSKRDSYIIDEQSEKDDISEHCSAEEQGEDTLSGCYPTLGAPFVSHKSVRGRRKSIHPGAGLPDITLAAANHLSIGTPLKEPEPVREESYQVDINVDKEGNHEVQGTENHSGILHNVNEAPPPTCSSQLPRHYQELQMLSAGTEARQSQIRQVLIDLEGVHKRLEELQCTIRIKEQFVADMIKNSEMRASAKERFQRKRSKLEEEYYKTRTHLAQAESALLLAAKDSDLNEEKLQYKKEIEKYKSLAVHYEKRLKDIEMIKQIAGDSARKVLELENSLQSSKRQMEKLKKQLKREEQHKQYLEQELLEDQRKIKELEQKYNLQTSKLQLNDKDAGKAPDEERLRWIQEEEERIASMRESSQRLQEQLLQQQAMLEKREAFLKEKLCLEKRRTKSIREVSARISHLEQVLKEKSTDLEKTEDLDEKEALRHEIQSLRKTKECLSKERCGLDEKLQKDKKLSSIEERKLLECEEAIEAIDAAIEYKNELICGRKGQGLDNSRVQREKGEKLLLERLMKLSPMEMRTLLYKYFQKVIDLRENGSKMEVQLAELELQTEAQAWKIQALINALQQSHFEAERRIVFLQKEHEEKLHVMLRHFAEESSGSSGAEAASRHLLLDRDAELGKYKRENRTLKKRIQELEALFKIDARVRRRSRSVSPVTIPQQNLKQLQGSGSVPTTKVTREKNKLIIQQHKSKKTSWS